MSVFKTDGVVLQVGKISEKELFYKILFRDYGILTVKKRKKTREKPIDIGYHVNCEIITHKDKNIHTVGNIKILSFFSVENRKYSDIEAFLKILSKIFKELPHGSPHYEIYDVLIILIKLEKDITSHRLLLTHLKIIQLLGDLPGIHKDITTQKTLKYSGNSSSTFNKTYMIKLKPHHVGAYINFFKKNKHMIDEKEYIKSFLEKNSGYHNEVFIKYWRNFLLFLGKNPKISFIYSFEYDDVCTNCDIQKECKENTSELHFLVKKLDIKYHRKLKLVPNKVYTIKEINTFIET